MFSKLVNLIERSPYYNKRTQEIIYIIPHCTDAHMTAARIGQSFKNRPKDKEASCNYGCGSDGLIIGIADEDTRRSWCTSSEWADQRGITFEISSAHGAPNEMDAPALECWKNLVVEIMTRRGKNKLVYIPDGTKAKAYTPKANEMVILLHKWFKNKACPGVWFIERLPSIVAEINTRLSSEAPAAVAEPSNTEEYTVKPKDSLTKIGVIYGFTADELAAYNGIKNKNLIHPGDVIKIPPRNKEALTPAKAADILQKVKENTPGGLTATEINEAFDMAIKLLREQK